MLATHKLVFRQDLELDKMSVPLPLLPGHNRFNNKPQFYNRLQFNNSSQF
jgi:hypothetical protein